MLLWLACATPSDTGEATVLVEEETRCVDYAVEAQPFLLNYCTSCHSPYATDRKGAPEGVDLLGLEDVRTHADRVVARVADGTMPPGGGPHEHEVEALLQWVDCGLPGQDTPLQPGTEVAPADATTLDVTASVASDFPEGLTVRHRDAIDRLTEQFLVQGGDAWLVSWSDGRRTVTYDPPLQIWSYQGTWQQEVYALIEESDSSWTELQSWTATREAITGDGRDLSGDAVQVWLVSDAGDEHLWRVSSDFGLLGRELVDDSGMWLIQQSGGPFPENHGAGFPLREGFWTERGLWVAP